MSPAQRSHRPSEAVAFLRVLDRGHIICVQTNNRYMDHNKPHEITDAEWNEFAEIELVREAWGLDEDDGGEFLKGIVYGVRFDFVSGSPGYAGPLYMLTGDGAPCAPLHFIRKEGQLVLQVDC